MAGKGATETQVREKGNMNTEKKIKPCLGEQKDLRRKHQSDSFFFAFVHIIVPSNVIDRKTAVAANTVTLCHSTCLQLEHMVALTMPDSPVC